jgi:hypothetical protein
LYSVEVSIGYCNLSLQLVAFAFAGMLAWGFGFKNSGLCYSSDRIPSSSRSNSGESSVLFISM